MKRAMAAVAAALLGGCMGGSADPIRYFALEPASGPPSGVQQGASVVVTPTSASAFYGTTQIVYSDAPGVRARYRYSFFTERPQQAFHALLQARLQGGIGPCQRVLDTRVDELYHDAIQPPGVVRLTVSTTLRDAAGDAVLASRRFSRVAPARSYDANGAVDAMRQAMREVSDDIAGWVAASACTPTAH